MMAESITTPDPQESSKPMHKNINSQRSRGNNQQTFDSSSIKSFDGNYPRFYDFKTISSLQINPYNLIEATGEKSASVTNTGKTSFTIKFKSHVQSEKVQYMNKVQSNSCQTNLHP